MSRVLCVSFSLDGNLILSGSEDGNLRLWKKPEKMENIKTYLKKKNIIKKTPVHTFPRLTEKYFLPKLIMNIRNLKMKLNQRNHVKRARVGENVLPGTISFRDKAKKPLINLEI